MVVDLTPEQRKGLEEQIALDEAELEQKWKRIEADVYAAGQLQRHIDENKAKLKE